MSEKKITLELDNTTAKKVAEVLRGASLEAVVNGDMLLNWVLAEVIIKIESSLGLDRFGN